MQLLTEQEKKRIQRYCTYPKIAATALVMSFVACLLMLPLQMINDIAFHQKEFQPAGIYIPPLHSPQSNSSSFAIALLRRALECRANSGRSYRAGLR